MRRRPAAIPARSAAPPPPAPSAAASEGVRIGHRRSDIAGRRLQADAAPALGGVQRLRPALHRGLAGAVGRRPRHRDEGGNRGETAIRAHPSAPGTWPPCASSAGRAVFSAPVTLVSKMARAGSAARSRRRCRRRCRHWRRPDPAARRRRSSQPWPPGPGHPPPGSAVAPAAAQAATVAAAARHPGRGMQRDPGAAQARANARPMPEEAPVTSTCVRARGVSPSLASDPRRRQPAAWASL